MRKKDTWTSSGGLICCVACGANNTEICDVRIKSGIYDRHTRCLDCGDLRTVKLTASSSLRNPTKLDSVRAWWAANAHKGYTSASGARACSIELDIPLNTVRGLQRDAFVGDQAPPWRPAPEIVEPMPAPAPADEADEADDELPPRDRAADAAAGREAARQPRPPKRKRRYYVDDDGLFQPVKAGEPLHICPTCGAQAFIHYELAAGFGIRNMGGVLRPQSLCRACRTNHGRQARKRQLDIVDAISNAAPAAPAEASAYQNPPGLAGLLGGRR